MNNTLYQQLAPFGFAKWLKENELEAIIDEFEPIDISAIGSTERTGLNALAFRWLREEKDKSCHIDFNRTNEWYYRIDSIFLNEYLYHSSDDNKYTSTYEIAEHEALNKALEILSKGGDDE